MDFTKVPFFIASSALFFLGCSDNYGISGCKGREGAIKTGPNTLYLPYPSAVTHTVAQEWSGTFSHGTTGGEHALDFGMNLDDAIYPVAAGRVVAVKEDSGITCSAPCPDTNYVIVDHGNGFLGRYFHFCQNCVDVVAGQLVNSATRLGGAGTTGLSTGVHLHFEIADWEEGCTATYGFTNINAGARTSLVAGTAYTSSNPGNTTYVPSTITGYTFKKLGIVLTSAIPWYVQSGSTVSVTGSLTATSGTVEVSIYDLKNTQVANTLVTKAQSGSAFDFNYTIPALTAGTYSLNIRDSVNSGYTYYSPPQIVIY